MFKWICLLVAFVHFWFLAGHFVAGEVIPQALITFWGVYTFLGFLAFFFTKNAEEAKLRGLAKELAKMKNDPKLLRQQEIFLKHMEQAQQEIDKENDNAKQ